MHGQLESPKISPQAIELNPSCLRQTYSNRPGNGYGYESTKLKCIFLKHTKRFLKHNRLKDAGQWQTRKKRLLRTTIYFAGARKTVAVLRDWKTSDRLMNVLFNTLLQAMVYSTNVTTITVAHQLVDGIAAMMER